MNSVERISTDLQENPNNSQAIWLVDRLAKVWVLGVPVNQVKLFRKKYFNKEIDEIRSPIVMHSVHR